MWNKTDPEESFRNKVIWGAAAVIAAALIGVGIYYRMRTPRRPQPAAAIPAAPVAAQPTPAPTPLPSSTPAIRHPIPAQAAAAHAAPLPPLNHSDALILSALNRLIGHPAVARFLVPKNVIRRIVVTVDNLPRAKVAAHLRPVEPTPGETGVDRQGAITVLSARNYARYAPFVAVVSRIKMKALARLYFRLYPLFQQAYESLGYPHKYFNDRLVEAIDSMLATPAVSGPIRLVRPHVFWQFANPQLQALPAGQKLLLRMGPRNAAIIEAKLRRLRTLIARMPQ